MPLLKAKQALNRMDAGQILEVIATDQGSVRDFQVFATQSGNELLGKLTTARHTAIGLRRHSSKR